ncbi:MAG: hypothetical protein CMJ81_17680 [Planctomycetaceae bacterium]|nr:hypothetical protein [Planctomycetaceae bacterium]
MICFSLVSGSLNGRPCRPFSEGLIGGSVGPANQRQAGGLSLADIAAARRLPGCNPTRGPVHHTVGGYLADRFQEGRLAGHLGKNGNRQRKLKHGHPRG